MVTDHWSDCFFALLLNVIYWPDFVLPSSSATTIHLYFGDVSKREREREVESIKVISIMAAVINGRWRPEASFERDLIGWPVCGESLRRRRTNSFANGRAFANDQSAIWVCHGTLHGDLQTTLRSNISGLLLHCGCTSETRVRHLQEHPETAQHHFSSHTSRYHVCLCVLVNPKQWNCCEQFVSAY